MQKLREPTTEDGYGHRVGESSMKNLADGEILRSNRGTGECHSRQFSSQIKLRRLTLWPCCTYNCRCPSVTLSRKQVFGYAHDLHLI